MKPAPHDPLRLRDDPDVSSRLRDDLARAASASTGYDVDAGLGRFEASLGAGGGAGSTPDLGSAGAPGDPMGSAAAAAAKPISGAIAKGIFWGVVAVGVASVVSFFVDGSSPSDPALLSTARGPAAIATLVAAAKAPANGEAPAKGAEPPASAAPPAAKVASSASAARALPPSAPIEPSPGASASHAPEPPVTMGETPMPPAQPVSAPIAPPAASSAASLTPEMQHLSRLRALDASAPAQALAAAAEGDRLFPSGVFAAEREAIAISALARLGRGAEARARAEAFIAAHPRSHFVERIRRLTGAGEPR